MRRIELDNVEEYLRDTARIDPSEVISVSSLPGGVSNAVFLVSRPVGQDFVLKQAREQLSVPQPWFCSVERIWREMDVLRVCDAVIAKQASLDAQSEIQATTPAIVFEDRDNFSFGMTAAPPHRVWKTELLEGHADLRIGRACARLMADLHAGTWQDGQLATSLGDTTFFHDLRIDPYYRRVAQVHSDLAPVLGQLIESLDAHPRCLVHGDFSPKNLLVHEHGVMLIDFEVGHFGDPAFDLGFFLSHLVLKTIHSMPEHNAFLELLETFWETYRRTADDTIPADELRSLAERGARNTAGCLLARVDGKSQIDYLDEVQRDHVRTLARSWILDGRFVLDDLAERVADACS